MRTAVFGPGHVVAGRYRIEQLLGQGGMGSVYRALQLSVGRTVALKLLIDEHVGSAALLERFQREAFALSRLAHENTVRLFDFGTSERGCPFLVMEFLRGADLAQDLERQGPLRYDHALAIARQILCSLAEAHDAGIVHRDVKAANVFLCAGGFNPWPLVKVLDFGIVGGVAIEAAAPKLTRTGTVIGSTAYMSPEQAQGLSVGPASDLYAVGVVLFEMLTGRTPFDERPVTAQLLAKVMESAPRLRETRPELEVPPDLDTLLARLLARDPAERPCSARAVIERVDALLLASALPPLVRAVADAGRSLPPVSRPTLFGVSGQGVKRPAATLAADVCAILPKTEPMLVPCSEGRGSAPRPSGNIPPVPLRGASRRRLAVALTLAATAAVGGLAGPLRGTRAGQTFAAALAPVTRALSAAVPGHEPRAAAARARPTAPPSGLVGGVALAAIQPPSGAADALPANPCEGGRECVEQLEELVTNAADAGAEHPAAGQDVLESTLAQAAAPPASVTTPSGARPPGSPSATAGTGARRPASPPAPVTTAARSSSKPSASKPSVSSKPNVAKPSVSSKPSVPSEPSAAKPSGVATPSVADPSLSPSLDPASEVPGPSSPPITPRGAVSVSPDTLVAPEGSAAAPSSTAGFPAAPGTSLEPLPELERPAAPSTIPTPAPELQLPSGQPVPRDPREHGRWRPERRLSSLEAVEAAHRRGEISWAERNELVAVLRQLEADARARATRAYREGRISRRDLRMRQRAIDREFGGEAAYPERRGRVRLRW